MNGLITALATLHEPAAGLSRDLAWRWFEGAANALATSHSWKNDGNTK